MKFMPHDYQQRMIDRLEDQPQCGLFLDMGLGKTVITLTAVRDLIDDFAAYKVLVIAPKRVAEDTWSREAAKWDHLADLRISKVIGMPQQRIRALEADADVYVLGRDSVVWLVEHFQQRRWPFDMVVIDELSSFKNPQAKRFRALRKVMPQVSRVVGLTGTPSPNGLMDLWAEVYLLDRGERLGRTLGAYREKYFRPGARNGFVVYDWVPVRGAADEIRAKLSDLCVSMSASDYLQLPERIDNVIPVVLSEEERKIYDQMERAQIVQPEAGETVVALSAAAVMTKLLQMANGRVYTDDDEAVWIHARKLDALEEIVDTAQEPVLVFYSFRHDLDAIRERIPDARELDGPEDIAAWNAGEIRVLLAHPASVGYGLNLQEGGHIIVWYGLTWSLELYQQANARLHRQGQEKPVIVHHLVAEGTVDEQVIRALQAKDTSQAALLAALKERADGAASGPSGHPKKRGEKE
ncbi:MAG: DEAD/DEAH box helicase [Oscillospiraceae bacterium]|nr:DEAD/DEAH box helicase [Oscillospiraceae bacterium]